MLIESINDEIAIAIIEKDIKAMSKAIASLKKHRLLVKKVKVAISSGRITEERGHELLSSLHSSISDDLYIIQERGLGLGQCDDESQWTEAAGHLAQHYINAAK